MVEAGGCISSANISGHYPNNDNCTIEVHSTTSAMISVQRFQTEDYFDKLEVNGQEYSGNIGPQGVYPSGIIRWTSESW